MNNRRPMLAAVAVGCLLLTGCSDGRHVFGKHTVEGVYYVDCATGKTTKDAEGKNVAVIVHQVVTKKEWDKVKAGDPC